MLLNPLNGPLSPEQEKQVHFITGYGGPEDRYKALQARCHHHLVKPVKPDELDRLLTEL